MTRLPARRFFLLLLLACGLFLKPAGAQTPTSHTVRSYRNGNDAARKPSPVYHSIWTNSLIDSRSTLLNDGAALFVIDHGSLLRFNSVTGHVAWTIDLLSLARSLPSLPLSPQAPATQAFFTPILAANGLVITGASTRKAGQLIALDEKTGAIRWRYLSAATQPKVLVPGVSAPPQTSQAGIDISDSSASRGCLLGQPVVWKDSLIIRTNKGLTAVALNDGHELWNTPIDQDALIPLTPSGRPSVGAQTVNLNSDFGIAYAFDARNGAKLWSTPTQGIRSIHSSVYNHVSISVNPCDPLLANGRLFVADGEDTVYAIAADSGRMIWQAKIGFAWRFCSVGGSLLACSAHGLFQIDPATGKILRQRLMPGGAWDCLILQDRLLQDRAVLIGNPYEHPGWEIFDWKQWKTLWCDPSFAVTTGVLGDKGRVVLSGFDAASTPKDRKYSLRGYAPSN